MIHINEVFRIVETEGELPDFTKCTDLYLDFETENKTEHLGEDFKQYSGLYPYKGDRIGSFAVTADDCPEIYYVPMRHSLGNNIDANVCLRWLRDHLKSVVNWVNHNVKFDAVFCYCEGIHIGCNLIDTLTLAKIHDSDKFKHGLKNLCRDWLKIPMEEETEIKITLKAMRTINYMRIPIDIMGKYACTDVFGNRKLYEFLVKNREPSLVKIWELENKLAPVLFDMETTGVRINKLQVSEAKCRAMCKTLNTTERLSDFLVEEFTNSNKCLTEIILNRLKLPILSTIKEKQASGGKQDTGRPTFDKDALKLYAIHPQVVNNVEATKIINDLIKFRTEDQFIGSYCNPFLQLVDDNNLLHPRFNPLVRTGRMSCSMPNIQQQYKRSKVLILPHEGYGFIRDDYSQLEFRLIAHYIQDQNAIKAYNDDPNTDFHKWVMDLIGTTDRGAAKTVNFGAAYGQGELGVTSQLAGNADVIKDINDILNKQIQEGKITEEEKSRQFEIMCRMRASALYKTYHAKLPGIRRTALKAASLCRRRGWVKTAYGRRRYLPRDFSYRAFNSVIQGTAGDLVKEAMIRLSPRYNDTSKRIGLLLSINVHDEIVSMVPEDRLLDKEVHDHIIGILENPSVTFDVPIKAGLGISKNNWAEASIDETIRDSSGTIIGGKII